MIFIRLKKGQLKTRVIPSNLDLSFCLSKINCHNDNINLATIVFRKEATAALL